MLLLMVIMAMMMVTIYSALSTHLSFDSCVSESKMKYRYHFAQTIRLFKPNILFKSFEMKDTVDRVLVYVTLYIVGE